MFSLLNKIINNRKLRSKKRGFIVSLAATIGAVVGGLVVSGLTTLGVGAGVAMAIGTGVAWMTTAAVLAASIYGGTAVSRALSGKSKGGVETSPTYGSTVLQTRTDNSSAVPLIYGQVKVAGNRIWQNDGTAMPVKRLVAFGEGEITEYVEIKLNDINYTEISGCTIEKFYGTDSQIISTLIPGANNAERAELVGGLKGLAYLAITTNVSDKIGRDYNLTSIVRGKKVRVYSTPTVYTTQYSNNPAWCLLDFLTSYNATGMALSENGSIDNNKIASFFDIQSFIDSAEYCDEVIAYAELTTTLAGSNNDLIWQSRASGDTGYSVRYLDPAIPNATASIGYSSGIITVNLATNASSVITTTSNDIISLVNNDDIISGLVRIYSADDNDGTGVVTALTEIDFLLGTGEPRFTFNMIFDSFSSARDSFEEFKKVCRGALITKGEKLQFKIDKPEDVSAVFAADDIIRNSEEYFTLPLEDHYDILDVEYIDPTYEYSKVTARAELKDFKNTPPIKHKITAYGIDNFKQASRLAWYYLNSKILCPDFGKFSTGFKAYPREIGDVIELSDILMGFENKNAKITRVIDDNTGILDVFWRSYNADVYSDELGCQEPVLIKTNVNNPYAYLNDISSFSVTQNLKILQFAWAEISGANIKYEIRQGESWSNSTLVSREIQGGSYNINLTVKGLLKYWIKAYNVYTSSENATLDTVQIDYIPDMNLVIEESILANAQGTHNKTHIYNNRLKLSAISSILWQDLSPETWASTGDRYYAGVDNTWGGTKESSGDYVSQAYNIGGVLTSVINFNYDYYSESSASSVGIYWRYSDDNITWSDWKLLNIGSYTFRYYQVKIEFINPEGKNIYLSNLVLAIDVPDREENYINRPITNAINGVTISFADDDESRIKENFVIYEPQILATSKSNSAYAVVTASNSTSCTVKLYDNTGTLTTGNVNIRARGY